MASKICRTMSGARPSDGSSSSRSSRPAHQRPRDREHLLLAARQGAAALSEPLPQTREQRQDSLNVFGEFAFGGDGGAYLQIFQHRHARKYASAFRRLCELEPGDLVGRQPGNVAAVEGDRPFARPRVAAHRHHQGGLAGAVGADQRDDLAGIDVEVDALERPHVAVKGGDAANGKEGSAHRPTLASTFATSSSGTPR